MNQEKEMTPIVNSAGEYTAPEVEMTKLKHFGVICASSDENTYGGYSESEEEG